MKTNLVPLCRPNCSISPTEKLLSWQNLRLSLSILNIHDLHGFVSIPMEINNNLLRLHCTRRKDINEERYLVIQLPTIMAVFRNEKYNQKSWSLIFSGLQKSEDSALIFALFMWNAQKEKKKNQIKIMPWASVCLGQTPGRKDTHKLSCCSSEKADPQGSNLLINRTACRKSNGGFCIQQQQTCSIK